MKLVAKQRFTYARRDLRVGDDFYALSRQDARVLVAVGRAEPARPVPVPRDPEKPKRKYTRRSQTAE